MPPTKAESLYTQHKAAVSHERFTMDTPVYVQRDEARAEAARAWQENEELRLSLCNAIAILGAISALRGAAIGAVLFPKTHDKVFDDIDAVCNASRALLARKPA